MSHHSLLRPSFLDFIQVLQQYTYLSQNGPLLKHVSILAKQNYMFYTDRKNTDYLAKFWVRDNSSFPINR